MMYEKHEMETILFDEGNVYTGLVLFGEDGNTGGTYSWEPDRSDS